MSLLYNLLIHLYQLAIRVAAPFNRKARLWYSGRAGIMDEIRRAMKENAAGEKKIAWFHCASLGEFEQGRPVMEKFRETFPGYKIFLTFFSPSGYEIRKNWPGADFIFYLPADTRKNASLFLDLVKPSLVFFIKYEYWFNYLQCISDRKIPCYLVSAIFREDQHFFSWYGSWPRKMLKGITWFFVQDDQSEKLLRSIGVSTLSITGDTRFDRVFAISSEKRTFPVIETFCAGSRVIVAGSTWKEDEDFLIPMINGRQGLKFIIAPHETDPGHIQQLTARIPGSFLKYSEATEATAAGAGVLLIDSIGILAYLYRYAYIAYVGGGFGAGIHNILEAAANGVPVVFGPNYHKFREASDLIGLGGAFSFSNETEFTRLVGNLMDEPDQYRDAAAKTAQYVASNHGATEKIISHIHG